MTNKDEEDEDEDDDDDDDDSNEPLGNGVDSVSWLPSVMGAKSIAVSGMRMVRFWIYAMVSFVMMDHFLTVFVAFVPFFAPDKLGC
jgi:hypothetical protein